jgi:hypothetical protein
MMTPPISLGLFLKPTPGRKHFSLRMMLATCPVSKTEADKHYSKYKYNVFGHYPSSCLYLKALSCLFFKTQRFRDWILSPSSGKTY